MWPMIYENCNVVDIEYRDHICFFMQLHLLGPLGDV